MHLAPLRFIRCFNISQFQSSSSGASAMKKSRFSPEPEYNIVNGVRYVKPYVHEFKTFAKGRWLGRELIEVLTTEFGSHEPSYWNHAVDNGFVIINGRNVPRNYVFQNSGTSIQYIDPFFCSFHCLLDVMLHRTHRHEPPIVGAISLVGETADLIAINKPSSVPMHPCGSYHHNTVTHILAHEPFSPGQPNLLLIHRLDR